MLIPGATLKPGYSSVELKLPPDLAQRYATAANNVERGQIAFEAAERQMRAQGWITIDKEVTIDTLRGVEKIDGIFWKDGALAFLESKGGTSPLRRTQPVALPDLARLGGTIRHESQAARLRKTLHTLEYLGVDLAGNSKKLTGGWLVTVVRLLP